MKIGELMSLMESPSCVKMQYTDIANRLGKKFKRKLYVPVPSKNWTGYGTYPFSGVEEIYDIEIKSMSVGFDSEGGMGVLYLHTDAEKEHN